MNKLHKYSTSEYINFKWFVKRLLYGSSDLDRTIIKHLDQLDNNLYNTLNLGCGYWTPYNHIIKQKSKNITNIDTSLIVRLLHPLQEKELL